MWGAPPGGLERAAHSLAISLFRFVADEPLEAVAVGDLAVRRSPRLHRERVINGAALGESVEPHVEHVGLSGTEQRKQGTLNVNVCLACGGVRPE